MTDESSKGGSLELNPSVSRRSFLKWGSAISGTAVASALIPAGLLKQVFGTDEAKAADEGTWIYSACNMCGGQSGIKVNVVDGAVRKIEPSDYNAASIANTCLNDPADPADFLNNCAGGGWGGTMCPKGNSAIKSLYDPDRILMPMKRDPASPRGEGAVFNPISWDDCLDEIKTKLQDLKAEQGGNGAHQLLWFGEDHSFTHIQQDFMKCYGSPNYMNHSNLCDTSRKRSFSVPFGDERPLADFAHAKYVMLWGWNPLSAIKWAHLPRVIRHFFDNGGHMVCVDPVFSHTAATACRNGGEWVPLKPGTDGAMALAMAYVIINESRYDAAFVSSYVLGFNEYKDYVNGVTDGTAKTPAWAEGKTGVPAATIERLAREISDAANHPAVIDIWSGPGQHTNAVQGGRAVTALLALTGQIGGQGQMVYPNKKGSKHRTMTNTHDTGAGKSMSRPRVDGYNLSKASGGYPSAHSSGIYVRAREVMLDSDLSPAAYWAKYPYLGATEAEADSNRPKAVFFMFQNWVMSIPNTQKSIDAINKMELVICCDTHLSETAQMADYIIPGSHALERYDYNSNWVTHYSLSLRQPVVSSWIGNPYRFEGGVLMELASRMGLAGDAGSTSPGNFSLTYEQFLGQELLGDSTLKASIHPTGDVTNLADCDTALNNFKALPGVHWPSPTELATNVASWGTKYGAKSKLLQSGAQKIVLNSASIYDNGVAGTGITGYKSLQTAGYDALPVYADPQDSPANNPGYPLHLVNWKQVEHTHSRTFNNVWLMEMKGHNPLYINSATAAGLGIVDGDAIKIESPYAIVEGTAFVTEGIEPSTVGMLHGFGHTALGEVAKGRGTSDGALPAGKAESISGQAIHKETAVKVYKA
ncbi:MAG: molybdopterin-containing oxidoreductase family protein [Thermoleophilia bacterium]